MMRYFIWNLKADTYRTVSVPDCKMPQISKDENYLRDTRENELELVEVKSQLGGGKALKGQVIHEIDGSEIKVLRLIKNMSTEEEKVYLVGTSEGIRNMTESGLMFIAELARRPEG